MNWRLVTIINVIIALVTVGAVIFDLTRPRTERSPKNVANQIATFAIAIEFSRR